MKKIDVMPFSKLKYITLCKYIIIAVCIVGLLTACSGSYPVSVNKANDNLTYIHFIDVGQADSILIESMGQVLLMDAGNEADGETVVKYLKKRKIDKIDYVIASHPHEDHIGGLDDVMKEFKVGKVFLTDYVVSSKSFTNLIDAIREDNIKVITPKVMDEYALGNASFMFVAPIRSDYGSKLNNYSLGIKLTDRENTFLLTADAEEVAEMDMAYSGIDISADVLKINHHGSITSSTEIFIDAVDPTYAVISVGKDNPYGNPSYSVMARLLDHDVQIYRTDLMGTITIISDGKNLIFKTEKSENSKRDKRVR